VTPSNQANTLESQLIHMIQGLFGQTLKVYLIVILGAWLLWMATMLLGVVLIAAMR